MLKTKSFPTLLFQHPHSCAYLFCLYTLRTTPPQKGAVETVGLQVLIPSSPHPSRSIPISQTTYPPAQYQRQTDTLKKEKKIKIGCCAWAHVLFLPSDTTHVGGIWMLLLSSHDFHFHQCSPFLELFLLSSHDDLELCLYNERTAYVRQPPYAPTKRALVALARLAEVCCALSTLV